MISVFFCKLQVITNVAELWTKCALVAFLLTAENKSNYSFYFTSWTNKVDLKRDSEDHSIPHFLAHNNRKIVFGVSIMFVMIGGASAAGTAAAAAGV